ncbi:MAG TPA: site-specific DNA-methyltransferase [bacterium]|nr:site-specific DNA-methyltransferase [bacterium]
MKTFHKIIYKDSRDMKEISNESIDLVVTSPPYPMIKMWDNMFSEDNKVIEEALEENDDKKSFELMHKELDKVWKELFRVLKPGGITCINIGDAVRTMNGNFSLYSNHSRVIESCSKIGFQLLPEILWRKQTNAPNKFMGSGTLPPGAYVTLEHEHILIFRKGSKREFGSHTEKLNRKNSSFFWEERNIWFSDIWENLKGTNQKLEDTKLRERSAAFPFELPYRLICMFSVKGDVILDPYLGTATTTLAAIASERNSVGYEIDPNFDGKIKTRLENSRDFINEYNEQRIAKHLDFIRKRKKEKGNLKYYNNKLDLPVMTRQEVEASINKVVDIVKKNETDLEVSYSQ